MPTWPTETGLRLPMQGASTSADVATKTSAQYWRTKQWRGVSHFSSSGSNARGKYSVEFDSGGGARAGMAAAAWSSGLKAGIWWTRGLN